MPVPSGLWSRGHSRWIRAPGPPSGRDRPAPSSTTIFCWPPERFRPPGAPERTWVVAPSPPPYSPTSGRTSCRSTGSPTNCVCAARPRSAPLWTTWGAPSTRPCADATRAPTGPVRRPPRRWDGGAPRRGPAGRRPIVCEDGLRCWRRWPPIPVRTMRSPSRPSAWTMPRICVWRWGPHTRPWSARRMPRPGSRLTWPLFSPAHSAP